LRRTVQPKSSHTIMKQIHFYAAGALIAVAGAFTTAPAFAQAAMDHSAMPGMKMDLADGEVRKIDMEAGKITLRHGEIKHMDMPPMTMVFAVKDKALLQNVKTGDKVKFAAVNEGGKLTVTDLQLVR
jgi:Cu(I)/Ag(I) efflux system protein CusF